MAGEDAAGLQAVRKSIKARPNGEIIKIEAVQQKLIIQIESDGKIINIKGTQVRFTNDKWGLGRFFQNAPDMVEIVGTGFMLDKRPNYLDRLLSEVSELIPITSHLRVLVPSHLKSVDETIRILRSRLFDPYKTSSQPVMLKATQQSVVVAVEMKEGHWMPSVEVMPYKVTNYYDKAGIRVCFLERMLQDLLDHIPFHTVHMHLLVVLLHEDTVKALCRSKSLKVLRIWAWDRKRLTSIDFKTTDRLAKALETCTKKSHSAAQDRVLRNNRGTAKQHKPNTEIGTLSQLESLIFEDITFSRKYFLTICKSLEKNQSVRHLAVKNCCLNPGFIDWTPLLSILKGNNVLKTIKLDFWNHRGKEVQLECTDEIKRRLCAILKRKRWNKRHPLTALSIHSKPHYRPVDEKYDIQMQLDKNFFASMPLIGIAGEAFTDGNFYRGLLAVAEDAEFSDRTASVNRLYTILRLEHVLLAQFNEFE